MHEAATKLPPDLVWSVMRQESAFDPEVVSPARAVGLMQLLPETARTVAKDAKTAHPYHWAGFLLIGDPATRFLRR